MVLLRRVPGEACTGKHVAALHVAMPKLVEVGGVCAEVVFAVASILIHVAALAVAHVGIGVKYAAAVVDVGTGIVAAKVGIVHAGTSLRTAIVACLAVAFEHDVDDAHRTFGAILGRGVGDDFDAFDALGRHLLQDIALIVGGESLCLAVDPYGDTLRTA